MNTNEEIKYMDQYETDWNRDEVEDKGHVCDIKVNEYGELQCVDCFNQPSFSKNAKYIIACLKEEYGHLWMDRYRELRDIKSLVRHKRFERLYPIEYSFYADGRSKIKAVRVFYEKVRTN